MVSISVLGSIEVVRDGHPVAVPGGRTSELLVHLALEAGMVVRAELLIDDLWAAGAAATRKNTLQSKVAKLRRALGDPDLIDNSDGGYRLAVDPASVDALVVMDHAATAARLLEADDEQGGAELATAALAMFGGEVLPGAGEGDWVVPHRARLDAARVSLLETNFAARLRLGELGEVIAGLEEAVITYPFQESLWELLVTALYRSGRQADALAAYQRVRTELAEELGLDPGPGLRQLEQQILTHDAALGAVPRTSLDGGSPTGNLPSLSTELVGRESEVTAISELLAAERLVELIGPGGVGKTAVALATGRRIGAGDGAPAGGVWLARLETAVTPTDVIDTLIAAMNVGGESALLERLRAVPSLVVLDNCEHVRDAAANLAVRLLDAAPRLTILCTSQVPLAVEGETVFELAPLALPDAVELFTRRANAQRVGPATDDGDAATRDLCRSLDGLPLAIELAAARTRTLSIGEIVRRLDDRFAVLSDPTSRRPERRRELKSTIRWSYDLLFPDDQRGLWALATFAGGAPLHAVESVLTALDVPATAGIDVVSRLASRSLVIVDGDGVSAPVRYRLLDSIRAFALEAMATAGLSEPGFAAHAAWFAVAADESTSGVRSGRQADALAFARTERANIDAALAWSTTHDPMLGLRIVNGFGWAWVVLGDSRGAQRLLAALDAVGDDAPIPERATALLLAAWIEASTDHLELARAHIATATELADAVADVDLQARCSYYLAYVVSHHGEFRRALELTDRADALYQGMDRDWDQAANWLFAARAAISADDRVRSVAARDQVEHWLRSVEDPWLHVRQEAMLGELARIEHRFDDAVLHIGRAVTTSGRLGFRQTEAYQTASLGRAHCQAGDYDTGAATLELAIDRAEATGDIRMAALARVHLGRVLRALGRDEQARAALEAAVAWHRQAGGGEQAALGECLLAAMEIGHQGTAAEPRLTAMLESARLEDDASVQVFALDALGRIAAEAGDLLTARQLGTAADQQMVTASHFITERDRTDARQIRSLLV